MRKRSNGEGNIRRLKSGTWTGSIMDGYRDDGKKNMVTFSGSTKGEVLQKIRSYRNDKEQGLQLDKSMSFEEWAKLWYIDYESEVQPSTYAGYKYTLKILLEYFGRMTIADIAPYHINQFMDTLLARNVSVSLFRKCRAMLIQIFDAAESNGLVVRNAARLSKKSRSKMEITSTKDAYTAEEVAHLLEELPLDMIGCSIRVLLGTGMRVQELLALHRDDIAVDGSSVRVHQAIKTVDGQPTLGCTKSRSGNRNIPVPEAYRPYVLYLLEHGGKELIWTKAGKASYYSVGTYRRQYYAALKLVKGVRSLPPHCCRHTYVTVLQAKGVPMETIAKLVGHRSIEVTDNYLHIGWNTLSDAVTVLNNKEVM